MIDIYSDPRIPFSVGVWCRTHSFHPLAVNLRRSLQSIAGCKEEIEKMEEHLTVLEARMGKLINDAEEELKRSPNGY